LAGVAAERGTGATRVEAAYGGRFALGVFGDASEGGEGSWRATMATRTRGSLISPTHGAKQLESELALGAKIFIYRHCALIVYCILFSMQVKSKLHYIKLLGTMGIRKPSNNPR